MARTLGKSPQQISMNQDGSQRAAPVSGVSGYPWPLTTLQSCSIDKSDICVEIDIIFCSSLSMLNELMRSILPAL